MKKLLALLLAVSFISVPAFAKADDDQEFILKAGAQPQSTVSFNGEDYDTNIGISAGFEYFKYFGNIFAAGAGAVYDLPRDFKDDNIKGNLSFIPMYAGIKLRTPLEGLNNNFAFISGRLGYSAFMNDGIDSLKSSSGGLFYAAGIGISISYLVIEAIYGISNYSYKTISSNKTFDEQYSTISIYVGFKFE